jgi:DNA-binding transcriptional ArsR family regulator
MQRSVTREKLERLLDTYFCDAKDPEGHESALKNFADQYLEQFDFRDKAQVFHALADENRLKILSLLTFREMCVCELTVALGATQPNLTYHIKKLENVGLVEYSRRGKWVYYSIVDPSQIQRLEIDSQAWLETDLTRDIIEEEKRR